MAELPFRGPQEPPIRCDPHQHLRHTQRHDLRVTQLPTTVPPSLLGSVGSTHATPLPAVCDLASGIGNVVGAFTYKVTDSGHEQSTVTPHGIASTVQSCTADNQTTTEVFAGWVDPWTWIGQLPGGGVLGTNYSPLTPTYTSINWCAVGAIIPNGITLTTIPYPANQTP